jgi:hypothetical protein
VPVKTWRSIFDHCNGGLGDPGDDVDDEIMIEPRPTRRDVLKAVSTIRKYIDELDDPVSRKIEELLGPFNLKRPRT